MCYHVHTHHTYCKHTVCAVYPLLCSPGHCEQSQCHQTELNPEALENNACHKCILKEAIAKKKLHTDPTRVPDHFEVSDFRACRFWAEVRYEFTEKYINSDPVISRKYTTQSVQAPYGHGPQLLPYHGFQGLEPGCQQGQPKLNNPNITWTVNQDACITEDAAQRLINWGAPLPVTPIVKYNDPYPAQIPVTAQNPVPTPPKCQGTESDGSGEFPPSLKFDSSQGTTPEPEGDNKLPAQSAPAYGFGSAVPHESNEGPSGWLSDDLLNRDMPDSTYTVDNTEMLNDPDVIDWLSTLNSADAPDNTVIPTIFN